MEKFITNETDAILPQKPTAMSCLTGGALLASCPTRSQLPSDGPSPKSETEVPQTGTGPGQVVVAKKDFWILNKLGFHARPATQFVKTAKRFISDIFVQKENQRVCGKSLISVLLLAAASGSKLTVHASGPDASEALIELERLFHNRFGEVE